MNPSPSREPELRAEAQASRVPELPALLPIGPAAAVEDIAAALPPDRRGPVQGLEAAADRTAPRRDRVPDPLAPMAGTEPARGKARADQRAAAPAALAGPATLVAAATGPAPRRGVWPPPTSTGFAEATTEVHVHIGRIEVTALHDAPPPRRQGTKMQPPMSLDAYLARPRPT
jgi:hypothetical protein